MADLVTLRIGNWIILIHSNHFEMLSRMTLI